VFPAGGSGHVPWSLKAQGAFSARFGASAAPSVPDAHPLLARVALDRYDEQVARCGSAHGPAPGGTAAQAVTA
jgi:hypothetical protein